MAPRSRHLLHGVFVALVFALPAAARAQTWMPVGPPGGDVRALAADPRAPERVYLGTADGVLYRSDDYGATWRRMSPGFPLRGRSLDDIVVDRRGVVIVGYWDVHGNGGGVARSLDGGQTFGIYKGLEGKSVRALAVSPSDPQVIAAGALDGVFRTTDGGQTWYQITPPGHQDLRNVDSLTFDPADPNVLYMGTWHLGWKTADGGQTWAAMHTGMIDDSDVMTLTVDRWNPQTVYATACTGIYRSTEAGLLWTKVRGIPSTSRRTRAFTQSPDNQNLFYAGTTEGLWISEDGTATWRLASSRELIVNSLLALPGGRVLVGTEGAGVLASQDGGRTFTVSNEGFSERFVSKVVFDRVGRRVIVSVWGDRNFGGVFVAPGPRGPWSRLGAGLEGREILSLATLGRDMLAGTDDGIFVWQPEGTVWTRLPTVVDKVDPHPRVTDLVALAPRRLLAATDKGLLRSGDGGRTWVRPVLGMADRVSTLAVSPNNVDLLVAATPLGFFRSTDGGDTWTQMASSFTAAGAHALSFMPSDDRIVLATTTQGLYRSDDQGLSWARVIGGIPHSDITGLAIHPDGQTIYASDFTTGGIFRSVDAGRTWERMPTDGLASDRVWTVALDPSAPDRLLVATPSGGLHLLVPTSSATGAAGSEE